MPNSATEMHVESHSIAFDERTLAFARVAEKYRARMLRIARRIPDCDEEAEDIVQDALLQAFRGLAKFRGDSRMETWLYAITQNSMRTYLRSRNRRECVSLDHPLNEDDQITEHDPPGSDRNPEEFYELKEMTEIMAAEIDKLSAPCRQVLRLCVLEELSQRTVAEMHDLQVATIKSRIFHAKKMLGRAVYLQCGKPNVF